MSGTLARSIEIYREAKDLGLSFTRASIAGRKRGGEKTIRVGKFGDVTIRRDNTDLATLRQVFLDQEYAIPWAVQERVRERYEAITAQSLKPVIVDAGANIGAATIWFKHHYPQAAIAAIEPETRNAALLRRNLGRWQDVTVLEAAVGSRSGFVSVASGAEGWACRTTRAETGQPIVTVAEAARHAGTGLLFIVKVDIEGFESDLFAENVDWLDEAYVVFIEPHDWMLPGKHTSRSFQRAIAEREFELFLVGENLAYVRV